MRRQVALIAGVVLGAAVARAHGDTPRGNDVSFAGGAGLFSTNFGGLELHDGGARYLCEGLIAGGTVPLDRWLLSADGRVVAAPTSGEDYARGIYRSSDASACHFELVTGSEQLRPSALIEVHGRLFASGWIGSADAREGVLVSGPSDGPLEVVWRGDSSGLVRDGDAAVAFAPGGPGLVRSDDGWVLRALGADGSLGADARLIGVTGQGAWFAQPGADRHEILVRVDQTIQQVLAPAGTIDAFASDGQRVWVQVADVGVFGDDGQGFVLLPQSPRGACLSFVDGALYACGIPLRDAMVLGVSTDGATFSAALSSFDEITGPPVCPGAPEVERACADELVFVRWMYGFGAPTTAEPEPTETAAEASGEPELVAEPDVIVRAPDAEGCAGAPPTLLGVTALVGAACRAWSRRRSAARARGYWFVE